MRSGLALLSQLGFLGGCGDDPAPLELDVRSVDLSPDEPDAAQFADDRLPVVLTVDVTNRSNGQTLLAPQLFSVETNGGVEVLGSDLTQLVDGGCREDLAVPEGQTVDCDLVFALPADEWPTRLLYTTDGGRVSTEVQPCEGTTTPCGRSCVDLLSDPENCGECSNVIPLGSVCIDGTSACDGPDRAVCGDVCVDLSSSSTHCGGCGTEAPAGTTCMAGSPQCDDPGLTLCGTLCVDTNADLGHCGGCEEIVPPGQFCTSGQVEPCAPGLALCGDRCVDLGADAEHCGECGNPVIDQTTCVDGAPLCDDSQADICGSPGECIDITSATQHCGECDRSCPGAGECDDGDRCVVDTIDEQVGNCDDYCASLEGDYSCARASRYCSAEKDFARPCEAIADPEAEGCPRRCTCEYAFAG